MTAAAKMKTKKRNRKRGRPPISDDSPPNKQLILEAALIEFSTHGYEGTKVADIAQRANVVTPAVQYHFKTKDELWRATMENSYATLQMQRTVDTEGGDLQDLDDVSILKVMTRRYVRFALHHPHHARIVYMEVGRQTERASWLIDRFLAPIHKRDRELFARLKKDGVIKPYPQLTYLSMMAGSVMIVISNVNSVGHLYGIRSEDEEFWNQQEDIIIDVLITGFLVAP